MIGAGHVGAGCSVGVKSRGDDAARLGNDANPGVAVARDGVPERGLASIQSLARGDAGLEGGDDVAGDDAGQSKRDQETTQLHGCSGV
jgi:hypothetical protein